MVIYLSFTVTPCLMLYNITTTPSTTTTLSPFDVDRLVRLRDLKRLLKESKSEYIETKDRLARQLRKGGSKENARKIKIFQEMISLSRSSIGSIERQIDMLVKQLQENRVKLDKEDLELDNETQIQEAYRRKQENLDIWLRNIEEEIYGRDEIGLAGRTLTTAAAATDKKDR